VELEALFGQKAARVLSVAGEEVCPFISKKK
jgi:hypothetical protein